MSGPKAQEVPLTETEREALDKLIRAGKTPQRLVFRARIILGLAQGKQVKALAIEVWLSILVRKVIRRGNFTSQQDLKDKLLSFIDYFNRTMAGPFKWTYRPLSA